MTFTDTFFDQTTAILAGIDRGAIERTAAGLAAVIVVAATLLARSKRPVVL